MFTYPGPFPIGGSWAGALTPPDLDGYSYVVYVALADNTEWDGSLQLPFHTIAEGLAEASGRTPTSTTPICVYVFGGSFAEAGLTVPEHVHLVGADPNTTIVRHSSSILSLENDDSSVSNFMFEATSTGRIAEVDGTSSVDSATVLIATKTSFVANAALDFSGTGGHTAVINGFGVVTLSNVVASDVINIIFDSGSITLDSSCTGGLIVINGDCTLTDNSGGSTVIDSTMVSRVWDEPMANHLTKGSIGANQQHGVVSV